MAMCNIALYAETLKSIITPRGDVMKNPVAKANRKINRQQVHRDRTKAHRPQEQRELKKEQATYKVANSLKLC